MSKKKSERLFWLSDLHWVVIEPMLSKRHQGPRREDDRRIISGILYVLSSGCRWRDCPPEYGPYTTVYNRFRRWSERGLWEDMLHALTETISSFDTYIIDSTTLKAQRSASGYKKRYGSGAGHKPRRARHKDPCDNRWTRATAAFHPERRACPRP